LASPTNASISITLKQERGKQVVIVSSCDADGVLLIVVVVVVVVVAVVP